MSNVIDSFHGQYRFLSNFSPSLLRLPAYLFNYSFTADESTEVFPTVEHAFQAMKASTQGDRDTVRRASNPKRAKELGHQIVIRPDWEAINTEVMLTLVRCKFSRNQNETLAEKLLATGDAKLIEGNNWNDLKWGCVRDSRGVWQGENRLGTILEQVRQELRDGFPSLY